MMDKQELLRKLDLELLKAMKRQRPSSKRDSGVMKGLKKAIRIVQEAE